MDVASSLAPKLLVLLGSRNDAVDDSDNLDSTSMGSQDDLDVILSLDSSP